LPLPRLSKMPLSDPQTIVDGAASQRRRAAAWLAGVNVGVAILLIILVWLVAQSSRRAFEAQARTFAEGLAGVAQVNIQSEFDRVDSVIKVSVGEVEELLAEPNRTTDAAINKLLQRRFNLLAGVEAIRLTDGAGKVRWGTGLPDGPPTDVADRDYFLDGKRQQTPSTFVSGPLKSRVSGNWVVAFFHPVRVNGQFAGLLYVSIAAHHFREVFERYELEPHDAVTLRRDDHRLVARFSPESQHQGEPGDVAVSHEYQRALAAHPQTGTFISRAAVDGELRTTAYKALKRWPFIVLAGVNSERFLQPWREQVMSVVLLAVLTWLLVCAGTLLLLRANRRVEQAMQRVADQGKRMQALLRTAGDGIHITDRLGNLVELSESFADMLRSSREKLLGRHISTWDVNQSREVIDAWLAKVRTGDRQRVDVQHRRDDGQIIDVELQLSIAEIAGDRFVFASARDVTEQRRLTREQTAMLNSDLVGIAKVANRAVVWCNRAFERLLGYGPGELQDLAVRALYWDDADYQRIGVEGYQALRERGQYRTQLRMRRKSGEAIWVDFGSAPLSASEILVMLVDITATRDAIDKLVHAASHDPLTQLPNRVLLHDRIDRALAVAKRQEKKTAVCYLDLDGFKAVNDEHGHDAGDELLRIIAGRLQKAIRPSDTAARLGGDEFVLVLACVDDEEWRRVVDRVVQLIGEPVQLAPTKTVKVGVTVGVALASCADAVTAQELIERADHVMLDGKKAGKGRVFQ
jgi:diguanylate cyclase (GGDEF)-like protein/PAS domain S-box-containing protein